MGKINVIIAREFNQRVRKKSFIITTILMPLLMVGLMIVPALVATMKSDKDKQVLVVDRSGIVAPELQTEDHIVFIPENKSYEELKAEAREGIYGILVIGQDIMTNPRNVQLYAYESVTMDIQSTIGKQIEKIIEKRKLLAYDIENLPQIMAEVKTSVAMQTIQIGEAGEEKEASSVVAMFAAYFFGFLIYMFVFIYGAQVMQGVIEEKSSRVLEIMVSSVRPFELMMGKILGLALVALTQVAIWVVLIFALGTAAMQMFGADLAANAQSMTAGMPEAASAVSSMDPETVAMIRNIIDPAFLFRLFGGFVVFFFGGYLLYAAMFAAVGSAVESAEDTQQLQLPITIPLILAIVVLMNVMRDPDGSMAFWFSIIPFTSPIIMMARLPYGVPFWQLALSVVLLYASFMAMVWMAGKIYRVGIFMYGKKPTWKELIKWMRYKY